MTPKKVVIVGGGSAGWMAAAYLDAALNTPALRVADITLVESPDVPRIGVGEATIPSIRHVLAVIGLDEVEFLKRVDGTFKHAIKYDDWVHGNGDSYYHAFGRRRMEPLDYSAEVWLKSDRSMPFSATVSAQPALCEAMHRPQRAGRGRGQPCVQLCVSHERIEVCRLPLRGRDSARRDPSSRSSDRRRDDGERRHCGRQNAGRSSGSTAICLSTARDSARC